MPEPRVVSVSVSASHTFSKPLVDAIEAIAGVGVRGDAHAGATARHRSRVRKDPTAPNLRQCAQLDDFQPGLMAAVLDRAPGGALVRKAGVTSVVLEGGMVRPGDAIRVRVPPPPHRALERV